VQSLESKKHADEDLGTLAAMSERGREARSMPTRISAQSLPKLALTISARLQGSCRPGPEQGSCRDRPDGRRS